MRITQGITYSTYVNDIMRRQESIFNTQRQLSTGKRVNTTSDDPVAAGDILTSRTMLSSLDQYDRNIDSGLAYLSTAEKALNDAKDVITGIQELAVSSASGTVDPATRKNAAIAVNSLFDRLVGLGNTNSGDRYIFSGYKTTTVAFASNGAYQGDTNKYQIKIGAGTNITVGVNGGEVFKGAGGGTDIFQTITDLVTALNGNNTAGIQTAISNLDTAFNQVSNSVADIGGKVSRLEGTRQDISTFKVDLNTTISNLEDADIAKIVSELKLGQSALDAALSSSGKVMSQNIFNYL